MITYEIYTIFKANIYNIRTCLCPTLSHLYLHPGILDVAADFDSRSALQDLTLVLPNYYHASYLQQTPPRSFDTSYGLLV